MVRGYDGTSYSTATDNYTIELFDGDLVPWGEYIELSMSGTLELGEFKYVYREPEDMIDVFEYVADYTGEFQIRVSDYNHCPKMEMLVYDTGYHILERFDLREIDEICDVSMVKDKKYFIVLRNRESNRDNDLSYGVKVMFEEITADKHVVQPVGTTMTFTYYQPGMGNYAYLIRDHETNELIYNTLNNESHQFSYTFDEPGEYRAVISAGEEIQGIDVTIVEEQSEEGNHFDTAEQIIVGRYQERIDYAGDIDFFTFVAPVSGQYELTVMNLFRIDPRASLYNEDMELMSYDNDSGLGSAALITEDLVEGETYYLAIDAYGDSDGQYMLDMVITDALSVTPDYGCFVGDDIQLLAADIPNAVSYQFAVINSNNIVVAASPNELNNRYDFVLDAQGRYSLMCNYTLDNGQIFRQFIDYHVTSSEDDLHGQGPSSAVTIQAEDSIDGAVNIPMDRDVFYLEVGQGEQYYVWLENNPECDIMVFRPKGNDYVFYKFGGYSNQSPIVLDDKYSHYYLAVSAFFDYSHTGDYRIRCEKFNLEIEDKNEPIVIGDVVRWECTDPIVGATYNYSINYGANNINIENHSSSAEFTTEEEGLHLFTVQVDPDGRSPFTVTDDFEVIESTDLYGDDSFEALYIMEGAVNIVDANYANDVDWFRFIPNIDGEYCFNMVNHLNTSDYLAKLSVYDEASLAKDKPLFTAPSLKNVNKKSTSVATLESGETYYIKIEWNTYKYTQIGLEVDKNITGIPGGLFGQIIDWEDLMVMKEKYSYGYLSPYDTNEDMIIDILDIVEIQRGRED